MLHFVKHTIDLGISRLSSALFEIKRADIQDTMPSTHHNIRTNHGRISLTNYRVGARALGKITEPKSVIPEAQKTSSEIVNTMHLKPSGESEFKGWLQIEKNRTIASIYVHMYIVATQCTQCRSSPDSVTDLRIHKLATNLMSNYGDLELFFEASRPFCTYHNPYCYRD